jgi:hypothetical protein
METSSPISEKANAIIEPILPTPTTPMRLNFSVELADGMMVAE